VAAGLDIPLHLVDLRRAFRDEVVRPFCRAYVAGRTPNPCVWCNHAFKFRRLLQTAQDLGADALATGHYARIVRADGRYLLAKGRHRHKDQSYFLFTLSQQQLARVRFPLGDMDKEQVRAHAVRLGLHVADKGESQDICFIPDGDYVGFLERERGRTGPGGPIVHVSGQVLGHHEGTYRYTVGQRRGLGIAWPEPLYVVRIDASRQQVVVGEKACLDVTSLVVTDSHWMIAVPQEPLQARCRIRYRHHEAPALLTPLADGRTEVRFEQPQQGVTPGQAAVFYDQDRVIGGGWIA
jgi:tRNA-specific 2-thiouridylase